LADISAVFFPEMSVFLLSPRPSIRSSMASVCWPDQVKEHSCEGASSEISKTNLQTSEALDFHWLLKTANPNWTSKELVSAKQKLNQAGIISYEDLEEAVQAKGMLNSRLRDNGCKAFGGQTLERLRKAVTSERERQRQAHILAMQRETRRHKDESKAGAHRQSTSMSMERVATYSEVSMEEPQRSEEFSGASYPSRSSETLDDRLATRISETSDASLPARSSESTGQDGFAYVVLDVGGSAASSSAVMQDPVDDLPAEKEAIDAVLDVRLSRGHDAVEVSQQFPSPFVRDDGLSDGVSCGRSWEWPLTRDEKKERVRMLDLEVLQSYKAEVDRLKAKLEKQEQKARRDLDIQEVPENCSACMEARKEALDPEPHICIAG